MIDHLHHLFPAGCHFAGAVGALIRGAGVFGILLNVGFQRLNMAGHLVQLLSLALRLA